MPKLVKRAVLPVGSHRGNSRVDGTSKAIWGLLPPIMPGDSSSQEAGEPHRRGNKQEVGEHHLQDSSSQEAGEHQQQDSSSQDSSQEVGEHRLQDNSSQLAGGVVLTQVPYRLVQGWVE